MTDSIVVLVPVLGRPHRAAPLASSVRSTSDAKLVFICSPDDTEQIKACHATGAETLIVGWQPDRADYAKKINYGYRETSEPWILCAADDLRFYSGWWRMALRVGDATGAGIVGTQDKGNALVRRGRHTTHPLVRRAYIEQQGGTFDGTGDIYSETYDHQYIDLELVDVARARGQWAFCHKAIIEHLHPNWKKGAWDAVYEKAFRAVEQDKALYVRRMRQFRNQHARTKQRATL